MHDVINSRTPTREIGPKHSTLMTLQLFESIHTVYGKNICYIDAPRMTYKIDIYSATHTAAIPIPVPTHMLVTPTVLFVRLSSYSSVET
jgi:hypothetical protein